MHKKKALFHVLFWFTWCSITSIGALLKIRQIPWEPLIFNHTSLILVFYLVSLLVMSYSARVKMEDSIGMTMPGLFWHFIFRREVGTIILILVGNIALSWKVDNYFYTIGYYQSMPDNVWLYADGKFARESLFASMGVLYGLYKATVIEKDNKITFHKEMSMIAKLDNHRLRGKVNKLYELLAKWTNKSDLGDSEPQ
jgi:hypothetical protein